MDETMIDIEISQYDYFIFNPDPLESYLKYIFVIAALTPHNDMELNNQFHPNLAQAALCQELPNMFKLQNQPHSEGRYQNRKKIYWLGYPYIMMVWNCRPEGGMGIYFHTGSLTKLQSKIALKIKNLYKQWK